MEETPAMENVPDTKPPAALAGFESAMRDQLAAAWELHVERVEEQLQAGWREHIERVLAERFRELAGTVEAEAEARAAAFLRSESESLRREARREVTRLWSQASRRLRETENEDEWAAAVTQIAAGYCARAEMFLVKDGKFRGAGAGARPLQDAPALQSAVETRDVVVTLRTAKELSETVVAEASESPGGKAYVFPVLDGDGVAAALYVEPEGGSVEMSAFELLAALAGPTLPKPPAPELAALVTIAGAPPQQRRPAVDWNALSREEQDLHMRAQRFARVQVAEMRLYETAAVKGGRAEKNLYGALRDKIDAARAAFQAQYLKENPAMADYLHEELVRTLANDDAALLGAEYPGPLA